jgi:DNA-binding MarR family transcriptional regulator
MPEDDLGALAGRLRTGVARVLRSARTGDDLPPRCAAVLAQLDCGRAMTPGELAGRQRVRMHSTAVALVELERRGYITRSGGPLEGTATVVRITEQGRQRLEQERLRREQGIVSGLAHVHRRRATWSS